MAWRPASNMVTPKSEVTWRGMVSRKSRSFSERRFCLTLELIGVHFSSIVNEVIGTISSLFIFFYEKILTLLEVKWKLLNILTK